jgi:putative hydrolase of the HAD superfamily
MQKETGIKNAVFDLGGVLLTKDSEGLNSNNSEIQTLLQVPSWRLKLSWILGWSEFQKGKISEETFFEKFLERSGREATDALIEQMKALYRNKIEALPLYEILREIPTTYTLYALTNAADEWLQYKTDKFQLNEVLKGGIMASSHVGVAKPNIEFFRRFIARYKINPQETVFIDDYPQNILQAWRMGFKTIFFKNAEQTEEKLSQHGLIG